MKQLTIRGFDKSLVQEIQKLAERESISLNKAVLRILHRGVHTADPSGKINTIGSSLDHLAGTWSEEEARLMDEVFRDFERIDPEIWP